MCRIQTSMASNPNRAYTMNMIPLTFDTSFAPLQRSSEQHNKSQVTFKPRSSAFRHLSNLLGPSWHSLSVKQPLA